MKPFDVKAQCIIDDQEGNLFLCPRHRREEAERHFSAVYEALSDPDYIPPDLPSYLQAVTLDKLHFFDAVIE